MSAKNHHVAAPLGERLPAFVRGHRLAKLGVKGGDGYYGDQELVPAGPDAIGHAEVLTSWTGERSAPPAVAANANDWSALAHQPETYHRPVLDLDFDAALVPSSSADHHHLYLDKVLTWSDYVKLLNVLAEVGIIEPGYRDASIAREFTSVRLPWVSKAAPADPAPEAEDGFMVECRGENVTGQFGPFRTEALAQLWAERNVQPGTFTVFPVVPVKPQEV